METNPLLNAETKKIIENELDLESGELSDFMLNAIWEYIINYIGYDPMLKERKDVLKGTGNEFLYLNCRPIKSVISLQLNGNIVENPIFSDEFINIYTRKGFERYDLPLLHDGYTVTDDIEVIYNAGYEKIPNLLILAAISFLSYIKSGLGEEGNLKSYKINTISYTFKDFSEKSNEFKDIMNQFKSW